MIFWVEHRLRRGWDTTNWIFFVNMLDFIAMNCRSHRFFIGLLTLFALVLTGCPQSDSPGINCDAHVGKYRVETVNEVVDPAWSDFELTLSASKTYLTKNSQDKQVFADNGTFDLHPERQNCSNYSIILNNGLVCSIDSYNSTLLLDVVFPDRPGYTFVLKKIEP